ncbi:aspartic peptidase domain-containing protein [Plectosphaerella cucumerina]|jgi:hypothetical protein|uniref:Aspartic peptidase domain-containing protein n=1 Tax=Plectosphaerella cucumerina TaxID=40658 RepID=A0A8K0TQ22_9PEZI|nr:aspartic peptidase domain-containing protein [Plectosphaerella cucumerina]
MASSRFFTSLLLAAGAVAQLQLSLSPPARDNHVATRKRQVETGMQRPIDIYNWFYPYAVNLTVGTPAQSQSLALTFSYAESVVLERSLCRDDSRTGEFYYYSSCDSGAYDPTKSDTYTAYEGSGSWSSYYGDSSTFYQIYGSRAVEGTLMKETVEIAGAEISSVGLLLANNTALNTGFLGLGYAAEYNNFSILEQLAGQSAIATEAFSLWAQDDSSAGTTGNILFGAVDKSKYEGPLKRLQASAFKEVYSAPGYAVNVTAAQTSNDTEQIFGYENFYASISPTTMITNLPDVVASPILRMANATWDSYSDLYLIDCNNTDQISGTFTLELGGAGGYSLEVDLRDLIIPSETWSETDIWNYGEDEPVTWCMFGLQSSSDTYNFNHDSTQPWVIGNLALKKTYMAFDAVNMEVGLAPLRDDLSGDADREDFESSGAEIPDSEFAGYKECFTYSGYCPDDSNSGSGSGSGGGSSDNWGNNYESDSNRAAINAATIIGVILGVAFLVILGLAIWAILRCRRIRKARAEAATDVAPLMTQAPGGGVFYTPSPGAPAPTMTPAAGPVPRRPLPAHVATSDEIRTQETRMLSPEPKSTPAVTPAGTVSPESTPRAPAATLARDTTGGPSGQ